MHSRFIAKAECNTNVQSKKQEIVQKRLKTLEKEREDKLGLNKNMALLQQFRTDFDRLNQVNENMNKSNTERVINNSGKKIGFVFFNNSKFLY